MPGIPKHFWSLIDNHRTTPSVGGKRFLPRSPMWDGVKSASIDRAITGVAIKRGRGAPNSDAYKFRVLCCRIDFEGKIVRSHTGTIQDIF